MTAKKAAAKKKKPRPAAAAVPALTVDDVPELAAARDALAAGRPEAALDELLTAWRRARLPVIADVIDALSEALAAARPELDEDLRGAAYHDAWMALADVRRAADVPTLLPGLLREPLGEHLITRTRHLAGRPEDPRIADGLVAMVVDPPATSQSIIGKLWGPVFSTLETVGDVRGMPALIRRARSADGTSKFWPQHLRKVTALIETLAAPPDAAPGLIKATAALINAVGTLGTLELDAAAPASRAAGAAGNDPLALVLADPTSVAARLVCADALLARGDLRGELIQLQHAELEGRATPATAKRVRELLKQHLDRWLPTDLQPVLAARQAELHLGFLGACEVNFTSQAQRRALLDHPAWATVRELYSDDVELLTSPALRSLVTIGSFDHTVLRALLEQPRALPAITRVGTVVLRRLEPGHLGDLASSTRVLPNLREVELYYTHELAEPGQLGGEQDGEAWSWLSREPLIQRLEHLTLVVEPTWALGWRDLLPALSRLRRLTLLGSRRLVLDRTGDTLVAAIGIRDGRLDETPALLDYHERELAPLIGELRALGVRSLVLEDMLQTPLRRALPELARRLDGHGLPVTVRPGSWPGLRNYEIRDREVKRFERYDKARRARAKS